MRFITRRLWLSDKRTPVSRSIRCTAALALGTAVAASEHLRHSRGIKTTGGAIGALQATYLILHKISGATMAG